MAGGFFVALAGMFLIVLLVIFAGWLVLYILYGLGVSNIAARRGLDKTWLAWVPVARYFTLGAIVDDIDGRKGQKGYFRYILLVLAIVNFFTSGSNGIETLEALSDPYYAAGYLGGNTIGWLIGLALYVMQVVMLYKITKAYRPDSATLYTVLGAIPFLAFLRSVFLFMMRNDTPLDQNSPSGYNQPPFYG